MAIKEYSTSYSGANPTQDPSPVTSVQPDLDDETAPGAGDGDELRSTHTETMRDKLDACARLIGDSVNSPSGSVVEILDRDHANGDARQVRLRERAADPTNATDIGFIYAKDVSGESELFFLDSAGNAVQLTSGGSPAGGGGGSSPLTTKGDVYAYDTADARLPVGTDGQVLTADSSEATGLKWADSAGGGAVSADGDAIVAISQVPTASRTTTSATFADVGAEVSGTFTVDSDGDYAIQLNVAKIFSQNVNSTDARFRIVIDGTTFVGEDDNQWDVRLYTSFRSNVSFTGVVNLSAGSHTISVQWKRTASTGILTADTTSGFTVVLWSVFGSGGGGGTLLDSASLGSDQTGVGASYTDITDGTNTLSVTFDATAGETVFAFLRATATTSQEAGAWSRLLLDNVQIDETVRVSFSNGGNNLDLAVPVTIPTSGSHTIKAQAKVSGGTLTIEGDAARGVSTLYVARLRGAVPTTTKGDISTFDSAPTRLAVGTDGQQLMALASATEGIQWQTKILSDQANSADQAVATSGTMTAITGLSHSITAPYTGDYIMDYAVFASGAGARSDSLAYRIDGGSWVFADVNTTPAGYVSHQAGSIVIPLTAGARTVEMGFEHDDAVNAVTIWGNVSFRGSTGRSRSTLRIP
jgi:hypothetical protein